MAISFVMSIHLSVCISGAPTGWICVKLDVGDCHGSMSRKFIFS